MFCTSLLISLNSSHLIWSKLQGLNENFNAFQTCRHFLKEQSISDSLWLQLHPWKRITVSMKPTFLHKIGPADFQRLAHNSLLAFAFYGRLLYSLQVFIMLSLWWHHNEDRDSWISISDAVIFSNNVLKNQIYLDCSACFPSSLAPHMFTWKICSQFKMSSIWVDLCLCCWQYSTQ